MVWRLTAERARMIAACCAWLAWVTVSEVTA
jgi:hypothetical protein